LDAWAVFLSSPASTYVLSDDPESGWFGRDALEAMPGFAETFQCEPDQPHYGFTAWDNFFTRQFRDGQRPIAAPEDNGVIVNACESAPYKLATDVKLTDRFWLKGQSYSLRHMFADDPVAEQFVGGTIYQAFLSALSYHRWHSPVSGTIVKAEVIDGSYYSEPPGEGFDPGRTQRVAGLHHRRRRARADPDRGRRPAHRVDGFSVRGHGGGLDKRHHGLRGAARQQGRRDRHVPLRRLDALSDLPPRRGTGVRPARPGAGAGVQQHPDQRRHCDGEGLSATRGKR
jgi:hypothetical protein